MYRFITFLIVVFTINSSGVNKNDTYSVANINCKLDNNKQIWPLPAPDTNTVVKAIWKSHTELNRVREGDWYRILHKFEYRVDHVVRGVFNDSVVSFVMVSRLPTPESGILLKMLPCLFYNDKSEALFYLIPEKDSSSFKIRSYKIWINARQ